MFKKIVFIALIALFMGCDVEPQDTEVQGYYVPDCPYVEYFEIRPVNGGVKIIVYTGANRDINIPSTIDGQPVVAIGNGAFAMRMLTYYQSRRLTRVVIPDSVTYIGNWAFRDNRLTSVTIPNSVTYIGQFAFAVNPRFDLIITGTGEITSASVPNAPMGSVTIEYGITAIGNSAFRYQSLHGSVTIPDSVTYIGDWAFYNNNLNRSRFGNSVRTINEKAFWRNNLTSVSIPYHTEVDPQAFDPHVVITRW